MLSPSRRPSHGTFQGLQGGCGERDMNSGSRAVRRGGSELTRSCHFSNYHSIYQHRLGYRFSLLSGCIDSGSSRYRPYSQVRSNRQVF